MRFLMLFVFAFSASFCGAQDLSDSVCSGINRIRSSMGLGTLKRNAMLDSAAKSQSDWMASVGRMDHLREPPRNLDEFRVCSHHPSNRVVNSGYFSFDQLFSVNYNADGSGAAVHPKPIANTHVGEIVAAGRGFGPEVRRPDIILEGWMNSQGHRQAILTPHFVDFGAGVSSAPGQVYWCVVFAARE